MRSRPCIAHIIVELRTAGAERSLLRLIQATTDDLHHHVICFGQPSEVGHQITELGVVVTWLDYRRIGPLALWQAWLVLRRINPQILQGWMYFGNFLAAVLGWTRPNSTRLCWNIRQSPGDLSREKRRTRLALAAIKIPGINPDLIIYNSYAGQQVHASLGYAGYPSQVITNGINTQLYRPDEQHRNVVRQALKLTPATRLVAMACRFHPLKGVQLYLHMLRRVLDSGVSDVRFALVGEGMCAENHRLLDMLDQAKVDIEQIALLGPEQNMAQFLPGLDLLVIASSREGTPNILLEAMACGVTCIATRVGDVERILTDTQRTVSVENLDDLTRKVKHGLANMGRWRDSDRSMIEQHYDAQTCAQNYLSTYQVLLGQ